MKCLAPSGLSDRSGTATAAATGQLVAAEECVARGVVTHRGPRHVQAVVQPFGHTPTAPAGDKRRLRLPGSVPSPTFGSRGVLSAKLKIEAVDSFFLMCRFLLLDAGEIVDPQVA